MSEQAKPDSALRIPMQFFAEEEGDAGQGPAVAGPEAGGETDGAAEAGPEAEAAQAEQPNGEPAGGEPAAPPQPPEINARFAQMRRQAEEARRQAEQERARSRRMLEALGAYGYQGTPEDVADALEAQRENLTVEQLRGQKAAERERLRAALENDPEVLRLKAENEALRERQSKQIFSGDLAKIRETHPQETAKDVTELGMTFMKLRAAGIDPLTAYQAARAEKERNTKPAPPPIGAVNGGSAREKDYYTPEEVDRLTPAQLDNPKIMERVMKSMTKW